MRPEILNFSATLDQCEYYLLVGETGLAFGNALAASTDKPSKTVSFGGLKTALALT